MTFDEFAVWLESDEAAYWKNGQLVGCSDDEIEEICRAQDVERVPEDYRAFLALAGRESRGLGVGTDMFYPFLVETKAWMQDALRNNGGPFSLPPRAFVFASHQGYNYWFLEDAHSEVPVVVNWMEGDEPRRLFRTFGDWLTAEVALLGDERRRHDQYTARGVIPPPSEFRFEDYRTIGS